MFFHSTKKVELSPRLKFGVARGTSRSKALRYGATLCLLITAGLAFNAIRLIWSNKQPATSDLSTPQVLGATDTRPPEAAPAVEFVEYKVQKGDTLFNVSQKFNITWTTLATLNNLKSPFSLKPGQVLKVPK